MKSYLLLWHLIFTNGRLSYRTSTMEADSTNILTVIEKKAV